MTVQPNFRILFHSIFIDINYSLQKKNQQPKKTENTSSSSRNVQAVKAPFFLWCFSLWQTQLLTTFPSLSESFLWRLQLHEYCSHSCDQQILLPRLLCKKDTSSKRKASFFDEELHTLSSQHDTWSPSCLWKDWDGNSQEEFKFPFGPEKEVSKKFYTHLSACTPRLPFRLEMRSC